MPTDKQNHLNYRWYVVRTHHRKVDQLLELFRQYKAETRNILEVYVPNRTTVRVCHDGVEQQLQLFLGIAFVLSTQSALMEFIKKHSLDFRMQYNPVDTETDEPTRLCVIPEQQMREFRNYNENYADKVVILERPYTDYAFNAKANEPNELVRVIDGPLAGCEGYICRYRRNRGLVFHVQDAVPGRRLTVIYPNVYDLHVVRIHNAEGDRLSVDTEKPRAADLLIGILQACGYGDRTLPMFHDLIGNLTAKPSLAELCKTLNRQGDRELSARLSRLTLPEAELIVNLVRYELDTPGYVRETWSHLSLRPFLTPTAGVEMDPDRTEVSLAHTAFTELIRRVDITEELYYPSRQHTETVTTPYYAHIGLITPPDSGTSTLFVNWDSFLSQYFLTAGKANELLLKGELSVGRLLARTENKADDKEKMLESFRLSAPTLYAVLTDPASPVKAVRDFRVGEDTLSVMALTATDPASGADRLLQTCVTICREINSTSRLPVWRRYLRGVWLHL